MQSGVEREAGGGFSFHNPAAQGEDATSSDAATAVFERVKAQLKARLGTEVYSSWFGRMKLAEASKGVVRISVPTAFLRAWINGHYLDLITELWKVEDASVLKVEIVVRTATRAMPAKPEVKPVPVRKVASQPQTALASGTKISAPPKKPFSPTTAAAMSVIGPPIRS
jgi:chromosomal replication initiator protein